MRRFPALAAMVAGLVVLGACSGAPQVTETQANRVSAPTARRDVGPFSNPSGLGDSEYVFIGVGSPEVNSWRTFSFAATTDSTLHATLDWNESAPTDVNLFVLRNDTTVAWSNSTDARPEVLDMALTPGSYEVAVKVKTGGTAAYTISLDIAGSATTPTTPPTTEPGTPPTVPPPTTVPASHHAAPGHRLAAGLRR